MKVIKATQQMLETRTLVIGFQGENLRTQLRIDCAATFAEYPNATPALAIKPPTGETYPVFVDRDGTEVVWDIVANNLILKGDGELQLTFYKDNVIAKTSIGHITVNRSLQIDGEMPDVVATWIENANRKLAEVDAQIVELEGMVDTATDAATRAEQSASTASTKAEQAAGSAATATEKATEATNAAGTATAKAAEAQTAAQTATAKATSAAESERIATAKAGDATTAAETATAKAEQATEAAQTATEKARDASASATAAHASEINAAESADGAFSAEVGANAAKRAAETSATQAGISEQNAGIAAQTATQKAAEATQSATNAAIFAGTATTKAEEAAESAQAASDAQTAVEQTAEQLADSLEQIEQNKQDIAELDERKANIDGYYPDMTVGNAEQLNSSKYVENSEPYTLRTSGGTSDIGNREYVDAVVGGTLAWNQMVRDEASENSTDFADVVTVTDAVEDAAGVKVKLEPVQDLHGYDNPWPAGGGVNRFDGVWESGNLNGTTGEESVNPSFSRSVNFIVVLSNTAYYVYGSEITNTSEVFVFAYQDDGTYISYQKLESNGTYTTPSNCAKVRLQVRRTIETVTNYLYAINYPNTVTTYSPYSNICPISGWTAAQVTRTGKNLFDNVWESGVISNTTGENMPGNTHVRCKNHIPCKNGQNIYMGWDTTATGSVYMLVMVYKADGSFKRYDGTRTSPFYIKLNDDEHFIRFYLYNRTEPLVNPYIVYGTTATDYEPYQGTSLPISWQSEAGTVYGGELDVTTGVLTAKYVLSVLDGDTTKYQLPANWYSNDMDAGRTSLGFYWYFTYRGMESWPFPQKYSNGIEQESHYKCDSLIASRFGIYGNDNHNAYWIQVNDNRGNSYVAVRIPISALEDTSTAALANQSAMDWLRANPVTIAYEIAEPITYTLTASQIRTLLGTNNVWADTGDVALTYTGTDEHLVLESGKKYLSRISGTDSMLLGSGQEITAAKGTDNVFDLTKMFGTAVADYVYGQGAAFFRKWFPNAVYPYNAGELRHVEGLQSHDMVGFNLFDQTKAVSGKRITGSGSETTASGYSRSDYIPVIPNAQYYTNASSGADGYPIVAVYDALQNFVRALPKYVPGTFTTPENAAYVILSTKDTATPVDALVLNLSHSGARNGEYEPYEKHSYPLDSTVVLRGIPKVGTNGVYWDGDRYLPDGTVERKRGRIVFNGSESWARSTQSNPNGTFFTLTSPVPFIAWGSGGRDSAISNMFEKASVVGNEGVENKNTFWWNNGRTGFRVIFGNPNAGTSVDEFKSYLQEHPFVIEGELAEPTTETAQPYHSTQWVSDWGTEEFVSTGIVPVGHETRYPANLRDKLQHLPDAASGNGSYLITQTDGQMVLTPFPAPPSTAGNYVLKATVMGGVATYTWEVAT